MKKITTILFVMLGFYGFSQTQTAAVVSVYTNGADITPEDAGSLLRVELMKTQKYKVLDKLDMLEIVETKGIKTTDCYGKTCLLNVGREANVDKVFTGTIENLGKKIIVSVKVIDVKSEDYETTVLREFINLEEEIQLMVQVTLNEALGIPNNQDLLEKLIYTSEPMQAPTSTIKNSGPRMGAAFVGGETAKALTDVGENGGYELSIPIVAQFGYQFEKEYLSSGNFQALGEVLVLMTGLEQGLFNPSLTLMNGFRNSKSGLEFAFGPSIRLAQVTDGYYELKDGLGNQGDANWHRDQEWYNDEDNWVYDSTGINYEIIENPNRVFERADSRGGTIITANWVWAVGKTFQSGYLNIPVNIYFSHGKYSWFAGFSIGFNLAKN